MNHGTDAMTIKSNSGGIVFNVSGEVATINSTGLKLAGTKGINFSAYATSASGSGSPDPSSNLLDDYEEGTWVPTVTGSTNAGTATYSDRRGNYVKVGKLVTVSFYIVWSNFDGTGTMEFTGLPFTTWNNNIVQHAGPVMTLNLTYPSNVVNVVTHNWYSVSKFRLYGSYSGGGWDAVNCDGSAGIIGTLSYFSND